MATAQLPASIVIPRLRIQPSKGWVSLHLRDLWIYRELLYFLTWRDIKVRYKQTALGVAWAILQPLLTTLIFTLVFSRVAGIKTGDIPYPLFAFSALVPWTFFSTGMSMSSNSLVGSANLITKVYFPRLTIPVASLLAGLVDMALAFVLLIGMMAKYHFMPSAQILYLPLFVLLAFVTSLGVGLWLSALNVEYRDIRYAVPFLLQFWMYATPIGYPLSKIPEQWRTVYSLNPMVGVIEGFRWCLLGTGAGPGPILIASSLAALILLVSGAFYFRRMEKTFADIV